MVPPPQWRDHSRTGHLIHGAGPGFLVVTPPDQARSVPEPAILDMVRADFSHQSGLDRNRGTAAARPSAWPSGGIAGEARTTDQWLQHLGDPGTMAADTTASDIVQPAGIVVQAHQKIFDHQGSVLVVDAAHHGIDGLSEL